MTSLSINNRFSGKTILLIVIAIALAFFSYTYQESAFPELSPVFKLKKHQVPVQANAVLRDLGYRPDNYQSITTFGENSRTKIFLDREYGLKALKNANNKGVKLWYWNTRYFVPDQKQEVTIQLDTEGKLVGYSEDIPETEKRPRLTQQQARKVAETFLQTHVPQHPLNKLKLIETGGTEKPGYYIHKFTWKRTDWSWGEGLYYVKVYIKGDRVGAYGEYLKIPESWSRSFANKRSSNRIYQTIAEAGSILTGIGALILFVMMAVKHQINWRRFPIMWMVPVGLVLLLAQFSQFPSIIAQYSTEDNFYSYIAQEAIQIVFSTIMQLFFFLIAAFIADAFWHKAFPEHVPIRALLNGKGLHTAESMRAVPLGFFVALVSMAYVTAYYMTGSQFGIWTPSSINYAEVVTSYFPAIEALNTGISAGWLEELAFRVIGLILIYKVTGSRWAAIILSAAIWGFMHSNYPQLPGYARGIELTLEGIMLGWIALRYGILTTFLSHCLFDTWLGAFIAMQTGSTFHVLMAVLVSVWPVSLWLKGYLHKRKYGSHINNEELALGSTSINEQLLEAEAIIPKTAIQNRLIPTAAIIILILAAIGLYAYLPASKLDDLGKIELNRSNASSIADSIFRQRTDQNPHSYYKLVKRHASITDFDRDYIRKYSANGDFEQAIVKYLYHDYWKIQYFRELERTHYTIYLRPNGGLLLFSKSMAESAPGAEIDEKDALYLARGFMIKKLLIPAGNFKKISIQRIQLEKRRDFRITFESTQWHIGESRLRWNIYVQGDEIRNFSQYIKLPDDYERKANRLGWQDVLNNFIDNIINIISIGGAVIIIMLLIVRRYIPWKISLIFPLTYLTLEIINIANGSVNFLTGYSTTQSIVNFAGIKIIGIFSNLLVSYLYGVTLFALIFGLSRWLTGLSIDNIVSRERLASYSYWKDGFMLAAFALFGMYCLNFIFTIIGHYFFDQNSYNILTASVNSYLPGIAYTTSAIKSTLTSSMTAGIYLLLGILLWRKHRGLLAFLVILVLFQDISQAFDSGSSTIYTGVVNICISIIKLSLFYMLFRFNIAAYLLFFYYQSMITYTLTLTDTAWPVYGFDISITYIALLLPVIGIVILAKKHSRHAI